MSRDFFRSLSIFFSFGIPIEKRTAVLLFRGREFPSGVRLSWTGCLAGLPSTAPWEAPSREGLYGRSDSTRQVLSITFDRFSNLIHTLWISLGRFLLIVRAPSPRAAAAGSGTHRLRESFCGRTEPLEDIRETGAAAVWLWARDPIAHLKGPTGFLACAVPCSVAIALGRSDTPVPRSGATPCTHRRAARKSA